MGNGFSCFCNAVGVFSSYNACSCCYKEIVADVLWNSIPVLQYVFIGQLYRDNTGRWINVPFGEQCSG